MDSNEILNLWFKLGIVLLLILIALTIILYFAVGLSLIHI